MTRALKQPVRILGPSIWHALEERSLEEVGVAEREGDLSTLGAQAQQTVTTVVGSDMGIPLMSPREPNNGAPQ